MVFRRVVLCAAVVAALATELQAQRVISTDVNRVVLGFVIECYSCDVSTTDKDTSYVYKTPPVIIGIAKDGPAMAAGLRQGDILTHINGVSITTPAGGRLLAIAQAGKQLTLTVRRGGQPSQVIVTPQAAEEAWYPEAIGAIPRLRYTWGTRMPFDSALWRTGYAWVRADTIRYRDGVWGSLAPGSTPASGTTTASAKKFTATFAGIELSIEGSKPVKVTVVEPDCLFSIEVDGTIILLRSADRCK